MIVSLVYYFGTHTIFFFVFLYILSYLIEQNTKMCSQVIGVAKVLRLGGKCQTCVNLTPVKN